MKNFTLLFLIVLSFNFASAQNYLSKSQHLLKNAEAGISVNEINDTYLVKTNFNPKLVVGSKINLRLTSESFNKVYSLILKRIYFIKDTKEYDFAIASALNSYPSIKVSFEKGTSNSDHDLFISIIEEGKATWMIYCDKI